MTTPPTFTLSDEDVKALGFESDAFQFLGTAGLELLPETSRFPVTINETVTFKSTLGSQDFEAKAKFYSARLDRMSISEQSGNEQRSGYFVAATVLNRIYADFYLVAEGELVSLQDYLFALTKAFTKNPNLNYDRFLEQCQLIGFPFLSSEENEAAASNPRSGKRSWTMITNHLGADPEKVNSALNWFEEQGATDAMGRMSDPKQIQRAYDMSPGLEVISFEIGRQDRSMSSRGQGFIDPIAAIVENFMRVLVTRKETSTRQAALTKVYDQYVNSGDKKTWPKGWTEAKFQDEEQAIAIKKRMGSSWTTNIGGAQQRVQISATGENIALDIIDPTNVHCGRFGVVGKDDQDTMFEFWQNRMQGSPSAPAVPVVPQTTITSASAEDPADNEPF